MLILVCYLSLFHCDVHTHVLVELVGIEICVVHFQLDLELLSSRDHRCCSTHCRGVSQLHVAVSRWLELLYLLNWSSVDLNILLNIQGWSLLWWSFHHGVYIWKLTLVCFIGCSVFVLWTLSCWAHVFYLMEQRVDVVQVFELLVLSSLALANVWLLLLLKVHFQEIVFLLDVAYSSLATTAE